MTKLDTAYTAAKNNDEQKPAFYNQFLNTDLYVATHSETDDSESIAPLIVEYSGVQFLMLFDTQQRLADWAKKEMAYAVMPGHTLVQRMNTDYHWALNVGTDFTKTFVPKEIAWLKEIVEKTKSEQAQAGQNQSPTKNISALVRKPKELPDSFINRLSEIFTKTPTISYAYLGDVRYAIENEPAHLTMVLETNDTLTQTIHDELQQTAKTLLDDTVIFDLIFAGESNVANDIVKSLKPFYPKAV